MILDYSKMPEVDIPHFKGGEGAAHARMQFDGMNRIMLGRLGKGDTIGLHTHETSSEIVYVVQGTARVLMDGVEELVTAGNAHYCPKGHTHCMSSAGEEDLIIFAVVPEQ